MLKQAFILTLLALISPVFTQYQEGDIVNFYVGKAGPHANPFESYKYTRIPLCQPEEIQEAPTSLGEILTGERKYVAPFALSYQKDVEKGLICERGWGKKDRRNLQKYIDDEWTVEFFLDDLPVYTKIGYADGDQKYIFLQYKFILGYNNGYISRAEIQPTLAMQLDKSIETAKFYYSVQWIPTEVTYENRFSYLRDQQGTVNFEIHWLSIIDTFVLVLLLIIFVGIIIFRIVKKDFAKIIMDEDDFETNVGQKKEEVGWKKIHQEVFRPPQNVNIFCAFIGAGTQLILLTFMLVVLGSIGFYYGTRGGLVVASIVLYSLTSGVAGYVSANMYKYLGGEKWAFNIVTTTVIFSGPLFIVWSIVNTIAWIKHSTAALPFGTILLIFLLWALVTFPLTVIGGITGRSRQQNVITEKSKGKIPKPKPNPAWHRSFLITFLIAAFLPFSSIYIELYYVFQSMWGYQIYTLYGVLFLAFNLLLLVTATITLSLIYFQLSAENYDWWWRSILYGGASAILMYLYSFLYYTNRSEMFGFLQGSAFYLYMALSCYAAWLMLGTIGFASSYKFVQYIYGQLKSD